MSVNFRRWAIVGFIAAVMAFSFVQLTEAGSNYDTLTTSDSGFFYDVAVDIDRTDGMIERLEAHRAAKRGE